MAVEFSIIITTFNYEKYLPRAIRSCLEQSLDHSLYETIVVDDGSSDGTGIILSAFSRYIRVVCHQTNRGLAAARNTGLAAATGQWVTFLDADDLLHRDFLRVMKLAAEFNSDRFDAFACDYFLVDDEANHLRRVNVDEAPIACGVVYRRNDLLAVGMFDERLQIGEDIDLRLRFGRQFRVGRVDLPLYRYRMHDSNLTRDPATNAMHIELVKEKHDCKDINPTYWRSRLDDRFVGDAAATGDEDK
ncbi:MAG: glycosyltransferase family 2 protein [Negativicutes bacterium]|nr:glycosyltransferase family 2 protein [Negativicutes bacterium]